MKNVIPIASLVLGLASTIFACQSIQVSKEIALESGSLDRSGVEVGIGGFPLSAGKPNFVLIGAPEMSTTKTAAIGSIPFTFKSIGKKSLDSLLVSFQYHDIFNRRLLEIGSDNKITGPSFVEVKKNISESGKGLFVSYSVSTLNPGITLTIEEPVLLEETQLRDSASITANNGERLTIDYEVSYSKYFGLLVSLRDRQVLGYPLSISTQKAGSLKELSRGQLTKHIKSQQTQLRSKFNGLSYLIALLSSAPTEVALLVYTPQERLAQGRLTMYSPTGQNEVALLRYPLLSWSLLFGRQG
jgi:hypothetical protein